MEEDFPCAKCSELSSKILVMECSHNLCVSCATKYLSSKLRGSNSLEIQCEICGCVSSLHQSSYDHLLNRKTTPKSRFQEYPREEAAQMDKEMESMLFCMDCQRSCFSIDDYLSGMHAGHNVKNVNRGGSILKELLGDLEDKVKRKLETCLSQSCKLTERKKELVESFGAMKKKAQNYFERLRVVMSQKEQELQSYIEDTMSRLFSEVDRVNTDVKHYIRKCEDVQNQILQHKQEPKVSGFNFYSHRKENIIEQINIQTEIATQETLRGVTYVSFSFEAVESAIQAVKSMRLGIGEAAVSLVPNLIDDFFELKRNQVFSQTQHKDFRCNTLASAKSVESFRTGNASMTHKPKTQKTLDDRLKDLQLLIHQKNLPVSLVRP